MIFNRQEDLLKGTCGSIRAFRRMVAAALAASLVLAPLAWADRTHLKPGWNLFSPQQDIELGRQTAQEAERQIPMLNDRRVDDYLNRLGRQLAAHAPGEKYPYQYKATNDSAINAFALPGGFIYINRGVIEAADTEAQLAGVMAHETSHVALRHGTNQVSKSYLAQMPLALLGGALGSNSIGAIAAQLGAGLITNSVLLKYSRDAERQADVLGTQILYDSGYDPRAMAQFFERIEAESKGKQPAEFFSNHPSPEHRIERVQEEVQKLGGPPPNYKTDSPEFREIKRYLQSLPPPPKKGPQSQQGGGRRGSQNQKPNRPADQFQNFQSQLFQMSYPQNWRQAGGGSAVTFLPDGGVVDDGQGHQALAYGMIVSVYEPRVESQLSLEQATDQLVDELQRTNPQMRVTRNRERMRVNNQPTLSTYLSNDSPVGGRETDWLVTLQRPEGLLFFIGVAPEREFGDYQRVFQKMLDSVRFAS